MYRLLVPSVFLELFFLTRTFVLVQPARAIFCIAYYFVYKNRSGLEILLHLLPWKYVMYFFLLNKGVYLCIYLWKVLIKIKLAIYEVSLENDHWAISSLVVHQLNQLWEWVFTPLLKTLTFFSANFNTIITRWLSVYTIVILHLYDVLWCGSCPLFLFLCVTWRRWSSQS